MHKQQRIIINPKWFEDMSKMERIKTMLASIMELYEKNKQDENIKRANGDFFNVFNTIGLWSEEVRLHSAFIAELLNPKGSHGLAHRLLQAFIEELNLPDGYINFQRCSQNIVERSIGRATEKEGGRIDMIIEDGNHAIIIENKIYAGDQPHQLLRYNNYGKKKFPNGFILIYLTLDGHEACKCSIGGKEFDYKQLSYESNIVDWLDKCYTIADGKPLVQSVIKQYCELIKQITYTDMDTKYRDKLMSVLLEPKNVVAMGDVFQLKDEWLSNIIDMYILQPLEEYAKTNDMKFGKDTVSGESGAWIYRKEWDFHGIFVWTGRKNDWYNMFVGVSWYNEPKKRNMINKKDYHKLNCLSENPDKGWPYGWEYLEGDLRNWDFNITEEIVNGKVFQYIKTKFEEILAEIEERKLPMP